MSDPGSFSHAVPLWSVTYITRADQSASKYDDLVAGCLLMVNITQV